MYDNKITLFISIVSITIAILSFILLVYTIVLFVLILKCKVRKEKEVEDINIRCFKSFKFIDDSIRPTYHPDDEDLGLTGRLFIRCYSGTCIQEKTDKDLVINCDDEACWFEIRKNIYIYHHIKYNCSLECFYSKGKNCHSCPSDHKNEGECSINDDDKYDPEKVCFGDNTIYFWKGKKFKIEKIDAFQNRTYTYIKDAVLKDEACPENTKNCGILDDEENKLCIPIKYECPPDVVSTTKLNNSEYSSYEIDNTTIYYTYDENAINNKIIAGLYVDSDIYINKEEENENTIILDTYTISGLLKDNYDLYRGVYLGYDPYELHNIDQKGKSYLKVRYNIKRPNLISLRKQHKQSIIDRSMNEEVIKPIRGRAWVITGGIIFNIFSICFIIWSIDKVRTSYYSFYCDGKFVCILVTFIIFFMKSAACFIICCINMDTLNKAKKIDPENYYNYLRILNLIYIILNSLLYLLYLVFILIVCLKDKLQNLIDSPKQPTINKTTDNIKDTSSNDVSKQNQTTNTNEVNNSNPNINNNQ